MAFAILSSMRLYCTILGLTGPDYAILHQMSHSGTHGAILGDSLLSETVRGKNLLSQTVRGNMRFSPTVRGKRRLSQTVQVKMCLSQTVHTRTDKVGWP